MTELNGIETKKVEETVARTVIGRRCGHRLYLGFSLAPSILGGYPVRPCQGCIDPGCRLNLRGAGAEESVLLRGGCLDLWGIPLRDIVSSSFVLLHYSLGAVARLQ